MWIFLSLSCRLVLTPTEVQYINKLIFNIWKKYQDIVEEFWACLGLVLFYAGSKLKKK